MDLQAINEAKVTYQGQGHTSRSRSNQGQHQIEVIFRERYSYAGGLHLNQMRSCIKFKAGPLTPAGQQVSDQRCFV